MRTRRKAMTLRDEIMKALCLVEMGPGFEDSPSRFGWQHHADALMPIVERLVRKGCDIGWQRGIEEAHTYDNTRRA